MPWEDDYKRIQVWKRILNFSGAPNQILDLEWFNEGNNWRRPHKVIYVLAQAGLHITEEEAQKLINQVSD